MSDNRVIILLGFIIKLPLTFDIYTYIRQQRFNAAEGNLQ
jgi:hypothetical protein